MTEKRKRGRPPGSTKKKEVPIARLPEQVAVEITVAKAMKNGTMVVDDPILAASLARSPKCESAKDHTPFPDNWDSLSKLAKLQWLTAQKR